MVNKVEVTQRCLDHIRANTPPVYELIIVADDSTPETLSWLMEQHIQHGARLVLNRERQNFSGAVNMGIKVSRGRYIAIVTNDVYVRPGWLGPLLHALMQMPALGWVSAQIVQPDGVFRPFNIACCLIDRVAIERVGLLDEAFREGKGFEDDDWYWRFLKTGYRPHGVRGSVADSPETATTFKSLYGDRVKKLHLRNQEIFYRKWGFMGTDWLAVPALDIQTLDRFEWLRRNAEGRILDLGSAGGYTFPSDSFDVVNLDIDLYRIPNFVRGDGHCLPFKEESFDTVALGDVMEHVDDPVQVMREAKRVGKKVIMTIPNELEVPSTGHLLMSTVYKQGTEVHREAVERWIRDNKPLEIVNDVEHPHLFHRRFYTEEMLRGQLEEAGLNYRLDRLEYWVPNSKRELEHLSFFIVEATPSTPE